MSLTNDAVLECRYPVGRSKLMATGRVKAAPQRHCIAHHALIDTMRHLDKDSEINNGDDTSDSHVSLE